jgi:8-oxo-dGTP pyrophosphatase MutT (NUDIX family)
MEKDLYFVAVKVLLRDGDKLLIVHDIFGEWEIPGGRLRKNEFSASFPSVMKRKISEELGSDVKYELGKPEVFFRVERTEHDENPRTVHIFGIGYEAIYRAGEIRLDDHHDKFEWVSVKDFQPENYMTTGWLEGIQEYLAKLRS